MKIRALKIPEHTGYFAPDRRYPDQKLRWGLWRTPKKPARSVVLLGGRTEFIEKYAHTIPELNERGFHVWSMDWRGQGLSCRMLADAHKGYIDGFETYVEDLDIFLKLMVEPKTGRPDAIIAHSMGGHIVLRYLQAEPFATGRAILSAPMTEIATGPVPEAAAYAIAQSACLAGQAESYLPGQGPYDVVPFTGNVLTRSKEHYENMNEAIRRNPALALGGVTFGWIKAAIESMRIARKPSMLQRITAPVLLVSPLDDVVVSTRSHRQIARHIPNCRYLKVYHAQHEVLQETPRIQACFWRAFEKFMNP